MRPAHIFYHVYLGGGDIPCDPENVTGIVTEQLSALSASGLLGNCQDVTIGVSGTEADVFMVQSMAPNARVCHNSGVGELPTMKLMQDFCKSAPGRNILYFHTKGAIYKGYEVMVNWRRCMENCVIWNWKSCVRDLDEGLDSAGCHWLTPQMYPIIGPVPYWGGNFFWARSEFLNTLPPINVNACRYDAEVWIGRGKHKPRVRDYARHWPGVGCSP